MFEAAEATRMEETPVGTQESKKWRTRHMKEQRARHMQQQTAAGAFQHGRL